MLTGVQGAVLLISPAVSFTLKLSGERLHVDDTFLSFLL